LGLNELGAEAVFEAEVGGGLAGWQPVMAARRTMGRKQWCDADMTVGYNVFEGGKLGVWYRVLSTQY
jgi:hypothetical protein